MSETSEFSFAPEGASLFRNPEEQRRCRAGGRHQGTTGRHIPQQNRLDHDRCPVLSSVKSGWDQTVLRCPAEARWSHGSRVLTPSTGRLPRVGGHRQTCASMAGGDLAQRQVRGALRSRAAHSRLARLRVTRTAGKRRRWRRVNGARSALMRGAMPAATTCRHALRAPASPRRQARMQMIEAID